mmetsp:Transcript_2279/g.7189  ORF Transcript_2279/g.7189 Transcript_2279/m.7189 type:complete len:86 (+) Transcript_2279:356-613(+)
MQQHKKRPEWREHARAGPRRSLPLTPPPLPPKQTLFFGGEKEECVRRMCMHACLHAGPHAVNTEATVSLGSIWLRRSAGPPADGR